MRQRGYLMGSLWFKLWRAAAVGVIADGDIVKLRYDDGGSDRLCIPAGTDASRWVASLAELREPIAALGLLPAGRRDSGRQQQLGCWLPAAPPRAARCWPAIRTARSSCPACTPSCTCGARSSTRSA